MPDITMCDNKECEKKDTCYRFQAEPDEYGQSYFSGKPPLNKNDECDYFWEIK